MVLKAVTDLYQQTGEDVLEGRRTEHSQSAAGRSVWRGGRQRREVPGARGVKVKRDLDDLADPVNCV